MSQITRQQVLKGGMFTIVTKEGPTFVYRVEYSRLSGKSYWFVNLVTDCENFYVGMILVDRNQVIRTKNTKFADSDLQFRAAVRVFSAILQGKDHLIERHGDSIREGTPNDQHEETPPPTQPDNAPECGHTRQTVKMGSLYRLDYDIHGQAYTMDYDTLYRCSIMTSESCYYFEASLIPWQLINDMLDAGCTAHLVETAERETQRLLRIGEAMIAKKLKEREESLLESIAGYEATYQAEIESGVGADKALKKYNANVKAALRRSEEAAEQYATQAKNYKLKINLSGLRSASDSMAAKTRAMASSYVNAAKQVRGQLASVAATLPAQVLADVLVDEGNEEAAQQFQSEFFDLETGDEA